MAKTRPGVSVNAQLWERFRTEVEQGKRSEKLQELMREYLEVGSKEKDALRDRLEQLHEELEDLQEEKGRVERQISEVQDEMSTVRSALKQAEREEEEEQEELATFKQAFRNKYVDVSMPERHKEDNGVWAEASQITDFWVEKTGKTREKLWKIGLEEVET